MINSLKKILGAFALATIILIVPFAGQVEASSMVNTAKSLTGIKYVYGGTTTNGFDCSGYVNFVFNKHGVSTARTASGMYGSGSSVSKSNLETGDLVFFNTSGRGVSHVGIYIGDGNFSHASTSKGVMISKLNDPYYWGSRYVGAKRLSGTNSVAFK
jgi:cell wall-associated NlpC family hydrolase